MQTENKPGDQNRNIFARYWAWHKKRAAIAKEKEKQKTIPQKIWGWVAVIIEAVLIAMVVRMFIVEPVRVDGQSMCNTLQDGEIVLAMKTPYWTQNPQRNDVVICHYPGRVNEGGIGPINFSASIRLDFSTIFVKRVVGVPGDYLQISGGHLYVNGELVEDPENMGSVPADYPLIHLGEDEYFVVGDNRRNSHDSRANDVGPISRKDIVGKVTRVILPFGNARVVK